MELAEYIANLLKQHDCVIVPHFGGFIANYKSAIVDQDKGRIVPPSKSVLFNPKLVTNDGLLGHVIADSRAISYPDSLTFVQSSVTEWEKKLAGGERVEVGEIGFLFRQNNQVVFEQYREAGILLQAYGLSSISFVDFAKPELAAPELIEPVEKQPQKVVKKEAVVIELNPTKPVEELTLEAENSPNIPVKKRRVNGYKYLAVAAAIPLLFYSYWIPMETDFISTGNIQMADFNPIKKSPKRSYETRLTNFEQKASVEVKTWDDLTSNLSDNVSVYNYKLDEELYIPIKLDKTATVLPNTKVSESEITSANSDLVYHLIGGCFSVKENADNFVADLQKQGYSASVLDLKGGLYRVSAGDYANRAMANEKLASFKDSGFSGWILKK